MTKRVLFGLSIAALLAMGGCGNDGADPNYEQKVTLTPEQKAAAEANMAGQKAPGGAPGSGAPTAVMPMPAGKGK